LGPAIEARLISALGIMTDSRLERFDDHVIVLGYGDLTEAVLDELELGGSDSGDEGEGAGSRTGAGRGTRTGSKVPFVVVATESQAAHVRESGRDVLVGTPSDEEPSSARASSAPGRSSRLPKTTPKTPFRSSPPGN